MGHLLFNEKVLLGLIAFGAWLFQKVAGARRKAADAREGRTVATGPHGETLDETERTRRVREEVARKIGQRKLAERKILMMPSARLEPPVQAPVAPPSPLLEELPSEIFLGTEPAPQAPAGPPAYAAALQSLPPAPITMPTLVEAAATSERSGATWLEELRQPQMARRAILLQEILGPPIALR